MDGPTPFYSQMAAVAARGPRFFVPGHKGNPAAIAPFGALLPHDLTEVEGAYDLTRPTGALAESEANMARAYGSGATLYSAFGSTSCIQAMLALYVGAGGRVAMQRTVHVSAVRALAFLDVQPTWIRPVAGRVQPADADAALAQSGAKALYVTSPDYYGYMADIPALAAVCQKHGAALLVDNAHGAYLHFLRPSRHPLALGAHATADSAHKTLPCLTPAALLHLRDGGMARDARQALNLFCGTSPAYPVLQSLDLAAGLLLEGSPDFEAAGRRLAQAAAAFAAGVCPCDEPLKLRLRPAQAERNAAAFNRALLDEGIACEYFDGDSIILMASPWNTEKDYETLEIALKKAGEKCPENTGKIIAPPESTDAPPLPEAVLPIRQALFGPSRQVPVGQSTGRVAAGIAAPCPPGVPLVMPGERIGPEMAQTLAAGGISVMDVVK